MKLQGYADECRVVGKVHVYALRKWARLYNRVQLVLDGLFNELEMRLNERIEPSVWRVKTRSS